MTCEPLSATTCRGPGAIELEAVGSSEDGFSGTSGAPQEPHTPAPQTGQRRPRERSHLLASVPPGRQCVPARGSRAPHRSGDPDSGLAPSPSLPAPPRSACTSCPTSLQWTNSTSSRNTSVAPRASQMRMAVVARPPCGPVRGASGGLASPNSTLAVWELVDCETLGHLNRRLAP